MFEHLKDLTGWSYVGAAAALTLISVAGAWGKQFIAQKRAKTPLKTIEGMVQIYDVLHDLAAKTDLDRALILYTSNGGGIPSTKTPVYTTILYELVHGQGLEPIRPSYQHIPVDAGYVRMLNEVMTQSEWACDIKDMPKGFLRDMYEVEDVQFTRVRELLRTPERYYFLAVRWRDREKAQGPETELAMLAAQSQIRRVLETS